MISATWGRWLASKRFLTFLFRVLNLEKKKDTVKEKDAVIASQPANDKKINVDEDDHEDDDDDDDENFDEFIDWRAKKSYKKRNKVI